jgi:hypothetical protein
MKKPTSIKEIEENFDGKYERQFDEYNPVLEACGHNEKTYLHKTLPVHSKVDFDGVKRIHPAEFEESPIKEGSIDERDKYVLEYQIKFQESIKKFYRQQITELLEQIPVKERILPDPILTRDSFLTDKDYEDFVSRIEGYNCKVEEVKQIINNIKK